ncbi:uncharacterized protein AB675_5006 [Cyphellophora attinorum]|uniref:CHRD domain-containing protein n=1 Tax=Cyphellophora attinorum TaxID=1664694 RepID=A0A0N1H804_9EURO|nr:uncharacterized protein AB675_5006 [Phialophora attinorum]KPI39337.1 hypothetical protein AB675_5006 [Phialophora attinorum]
MKSITQTLVSASLLSSLAAAQVAGPFHFTSTYNLVATPDKVIGAQNNSAPGETGAIGYYNYGINSELDIICYNITLTGGAAGPPRIAFPNPEPADSGPEVVKRSSGCITGPFTTGINGTNGGDTGAGFTLARIEANPSGFFTDSHTAKSVPGVVRAQLQPGGGVVQGGTANASQAVVQHAKGPIVNAHGVTTCEVQVVRVGPPMKVVCLD